MFERTFLKDVFERSVSTFAQTLIALVGTNATEVVNVGFIDSLKAAGVAAALSIVKAFAARRVGNGSASFANVNGGGQ